MKKPEVHLTLDYIVERKTSVASRTDKRRRLSAKEGKAPLTESDFSSMVNTFKGKRVKAHEPPTLSPDEVKKVEARIKNWDKRNY